MIPSAGVRHRSSVVVPSNISLVSTSVGSANLASPTGGAFATVNAPASITAGNFLYAMIVCDDLSLATPSVTCAGWTIDAWNNYTTHNNSGYIVGMYKVATASEPSSYSFGSSQVNTIAVIVMNLSGVNTSSPFLVTSATKKNVSSVTATFPTVSPTKACAVLLGACQGGNYSNSVSNSCSGPSGYSAAGISIGQYNAAGANNESESIFGFVNTSVPAGSIGTLTGTFNKAYINGTIAVALNSV